MSVLTLCFLACLTAIPYQYLEDYTTKSFELHLYRTYVMPPMHCGPASVTIHDIGWLEWSGYTLWKHQNQPECMNYVSKLIQSPWPPLFSSFIHTLHNLWAWIPYIRFALPSLLIGLFSYNYYSSDSETSSATTEETVPSSLVLKELQEIFQGCDEKQIDQHFNITQTTTIATTK